MRMNRRAFILSVLAATAAVAVRRVVGAGASGGDGDVYVTNLNDSGPGSLRNALAQGGWKNGRSIVFLVSGRIELYTPLTVGERYIAYDHLHVFNKPCPGVSWSNPVEGFKGWGG